MHLGAGYEHLLITQKQVGGTKHQWEAQIISGRHKSSACDGGRTRIRLHEIKHRRHYKAFYLHAIASAAVWVSGFRRKLALINLIHRVATAICGGWDHRSQCGLRRNSSQ
jgi:hypothetical protein